MVYKIGPVIELQECLRDSPKFRSTLEEQEAQIDLLELKLDKVIKVCGAMVDTGKTYVSQQSLLANSLWDLSVVCFSEDAATASKLNKLIHALQEMNKFHTILLDQASRTILKNLTTFVKEDIKVARESRQHFEKISSDMDAALQRNSQAARSRPLETEETHNLLKATRACFRHTALNHVHCVTMLQARKQHELTSTLLSYMHACTTYFHQGYDLCEGLQPFFKSVGDDLDSQRSDAAKLEKSLNNCHNMVTSSDLVSPPETSAPAHPHMEGYLFKRTTNAFKTWNRRWFYLHQNQLVYRKRTGEESATVMEEDLRLCSVKPVVDSERRFCFEVLSPTKSHMLQADSEDSYNTWVSALQQAIGAALQQSHGHADGGKNSMVNHTTSDDQTKQRKPKIWEQLLKIPGNDKCCDCGSDDPKWASINLGITLCIACSGVHRSLGVHYSKVRSLTLDAWEPEILKVMNELGNSVVNNIYEANVSPEVTRATASCVGGIREAWIKAKWVERKFVRALAVSPDRSSRSSPLRKWSVRKLRRRPHSRDGLDSKQRNRLSKLSESLEKPKTKDDNIAAGAKDTDVDTEAEVIVIGENLSGEELHNSIELSSGEDSTGGEENDTVSMEDLSKLGAEMLLYKASGAHNLPVMCQAMALGADKAWHNTDDRQRTYLHQAVISGSVMACEYLLLNGVKINIQDETGQTPLHLATLLGHTPQVWLLLKHRADQHLADNSGAEPLAIAIREANADIVTLLRLGRLNEEMDLESGETDDTFNDVVRDYSQLACTQPQRLVRSQSTSE